MKQSFTLIALVGMPGAGKSIAAAFFRSKGIAVLRFGEETDKGLKELGMELNEKNERWYREKLRSELGMAAMAIKIEPRVREEIKHASIVVLDGLYSWEEYTYLYEKFQGLTLLCIYAQPATRYARLSRRSIRPLTPEEARSRDFAEIENLNKGGPIAIADYLIKNEADEIQFTAELETFFQSISHFVV